MKILLFGNPHSHSYSCNENNYYLCYEHKKREANQQPELYSARQVRQCPHVRAGHRVSLRHMHPAAGHVQVEQGAVHAGTLLMYAQVLLLRMLIFLLQEMAHNHMWSVRECQAAQGALLFSKVIYT